jgi:hypothetical protein
VKLWKSDAAKPAAVASSPLHQKHLFTCLFPPANAYLDHVLPQRCPKTRAVNYTPKCKSVRENMGDLENACATSRGVFGQSEHVAILSQNSETPIFLERSRDQNVVQFTKSVSKLRPCISEVRRKANGSKCFHLKKRHELAIPMLS